MLNIPNVGNPLEALLRGIESGGNIYTRLMSPILQREQMAQQKAHFDQEMGLKNAQFARLGQNEDLNRQILQEKLLGLQHQNDPMYEFEQYKSLQDMLNGTPQIFEESKFKPETTINLEDLRKNPILRGFFAHKFGFDPLAEPELTPQQKQAMDIENFRQKKAIENEYNQRNGIAQTPEDKLKMAVELFRQKEAIKAQTKGGNAPTNAVLTQNQKAIQAIDTSLPIIEELINDKNLPGITSFNPSTKARYMAKTGAIIDTLMSAMNLPQTQASIDLVEDQIRRHTGETLPNYKNRLKSFKKDLLERRKIAQSVVEKRRINSESNRDISEMSDDELEEIAGGM